MRAGPGGRSRGGVRGGAAGSAKRGARAGPRQSASRSARRRWPSTASARCPTTGSSPKRRLSLYRRGRDGCRTGSATARGQAQTLLYQGYVYSDLSRLDEARDLLRARAVSLDLAGRPARAGDHPGRRRATADAPRRVPGGAERVRGRAGAAAAHGRRGLGREQPDRHREGLPGHGRDPAPPSSTGSAPPACSRRRGSRTVSVDVLIVARRDLSRLGRRRQGPQPVRAGARPRRGAGDRALEGKRAPIHRRGPPDPPARRARAREYLERSLDVQAVPRSRSGPAARGANARRPGRDPRASRTDTGSRSRYFERRAGAQPGRQRPRDGSERALRPGADLRSASTISTPRAGTSSVR